MSTARRQDVAAAFAAAADYDAAAIAQRQVAARLAARLDRLDLPPSLQAVEIGCGTGLLTRAALRHAGRWLITDIAPAMVERCAARLGGSADFRVRGGSADFRVLDGEAPDLALASCDLIVSSLAFQWFTDLPAALPRLAACLKPGGRLLFATLGAETFTEWRAAHHALGLSTGTPALPSPEALRQALPANGVGTVEAEVLTVWHPDAQGFLRALRTIGAHLPTPGHRPLPPGALRRVLRRFGGGCPATYHVLYASWRKEMAT